MLNLARLDLNLLVALHVLLEERSVTGAAQRLGLGQPALSGSLARLRRHFDDELLVRVGNTHRLTPLGEQLLERTDVALAGAERVFYPYGDFDPARSDREFGLVLADTGIATFGKLLADLIREQAPNVALHLRQNAPYELADPIELLRREDGVVLPHGVLAGMPHLDLYEDRWVCLVAQEHPAAAGGLTMADLERYPWIVPYHRRLELISPLHEMYTVHGIEPRVSLVIENFLTLPYLLPGSEQIAVAPERLVRTFTASSGVRTVSSPVDTGGVTVALWWHPMYDHDAGHRWLREKVLEVRDLMTDL